MSITISDVPGPLAIIGSLSPGARLHGFVTLTKEVDDFFQRDVHLPGLGEQRIKAFAQNLEAFALGQGRATLGDIRPRRTPFRDDTGLLQLRVSPGDGV